MKMRYTYNMKCKDAKNFITHWETEVPFSVFPNELDDFKIHLSECTSCCAQFSSLLFFIEKEVRSSVSKPDMAFVENVMDTILADELIQKKGSRFTRLNWYPLIVAALIVVVFGAGFLYRGLIFPPQGDAVSVCFSFNAPEASSVVLVGSFPEWSVNTNHAMEKNAAGKWILNIKLKKSGIYTYNFLVDGNIWVPDPDATEVIDDGFGGTNSLLRL